ncbi:MAG: hypothetical protein ABSH40_03590 [Bryobacteraceae bacterium]|jgi:hypothetical protein
MALLTLAAFSAAAGVLILVVFKAISNQRALEAARRKLRAHLLAIRLFADDPVVILRSQGRLLVWTLRYMALLAPAFLVIAIPLFLAWDRLDAVWGHAPLAPGETVILTARLSDSAALPRLVAPDWLPVESPPVSADAGHEVSWRLRVSRAGAGEVGVIAGTERASRRIEARPGLHYLPDRETAAGGPILWLEMRYPRSELTVLGVSASWPVWFFLISTFTALAFRHRLRVTL